MSKTPDATAKDAASKSADPTPDTAATADKAADKGAGAEASASPTDAQAATFTQADIDAAVERGKRSAATAAKKQADEAQLSETERLAQRATEAETKLRNREARDLFERSAKDAGAPNTEKLYRLVKDQIEFDTEGKPTNLKELVTFAKRDYPEEFGVAKGGGSADGGAGKGSGATLQPSMNDFIRRSTGRQ